MSISPVGGSASAWQAHAMQPRKRPPDMSQDDFAKMKDKLSSEGKDTSNIDKILENFEQLDTDGNGKISKDEMDAGASQYGIELPKGPPPGRPPGGMGPPPGMQIDSASTEETQQNDYSFLKQLLDNFKKTDPDGFANLFSGVINTTA